MRKTKHHYTKPTRISVAEAFLRAKVRQGRRYNFNTLLEEAAREGIARHSLYKARDTCRLRWKYRGKVGASVWADSISFTKPKVSIILDSKIRQRVMALHGRRVSKLTIGKQLGLNRDLVGKIIRGVV